MGNVESRPIHRPGHEGPRKSARPLPPLPHDDEEEYDLDSPPPYPPPPPPELEENGGKSKRVSWRFKEANFFGGLKKGSWVLQPHNENDIYRNRDESINEKNISNTIATEDNNVVTVSVIGTPDKHDVVSTQLKPSSESTVNGNSKVGNEETPKSSWALRNMQLVLNSEMRGDDVPDSETTRNLSSGKNYPYPDVQNHPENERSALPDLVTVKAKQGERADVKVHSTFSYDLDNKEISVSKERYQARRVEDIRIDYPEGKAKEVSNYNTLEYKRESCSVQPLEHEMEVGMESRNIDLKALSSPKVKKNKLGSCFGKRKADDLSDDEDIKATVTGSEREAGRSSSPKPESSNVKTETYNLSPKKTKKAKLGSCFGKRSSHDEIDRPISTSTPELDARVSIRDSNLERDSSENVEYITPKLEVTCDSQENKKEMKSPKPSTKSNLGSCFGKRKTELSSEVDINSADIESDRGIETPSLQISDDGGNYKGSIDINAKEPKHKNKIKFGSCFGSTEKDKSESEKKNNDSTQFKLETSNTAIEANSSTIKDEAIEIRHQGSLQEPENFSTNINSNISSDIDYRINIPSKEIKLIANLEKEPVKISETVVKNININFDENEKYNNLLSKEVNLDLDLDLYTPHTDQHAQVSEEIIEIPTVNDACLHINVEGSNNLKSYDLNVEPVGTGNTSLPITVLDPPGRLESLVQLEMPRTDIQINGGGIVDTETLELMTNFEEKAELKLDTKLPEIEKRTISVPEAELETGIKIQIPDVELKSGVCAPEINTNMEVESAKVKVSKKKSKFGACFGKDKPVDVEIEPCSVALESEIKVDPKFSAQLKSEEKLPNENLSLKTKKRGLGSCFGKKAKGTAISENEATLSESRTVPEEELKFETNEEFKVKPKKSKGGLFSSCAGKKAKADVDVDVSIPEPHLPANLPTEKNIKGSIEVEAPDNSLNRDIDFTGDVDIPVISLSGPDVELDIPKQDITLKGKVSDISMSPEVNIELNSEDIDIKKNIDMSINLPEIIVPTADIDDFKINSPCIDVNSEVDIPKLPEIEKELQLNVGTPNVELKVETPEMFPIEVNVPKISTPEIQVDISGSLPEAKDKELEIKGKDLDVKVPKGKSKNKLNCFGKKSVHADGEAYVPSGKVDIGTNEPSVSGEIKVNEPKVSLTADVETPKLKTESKKSKMKFGSCFGKQEPSKDLKVEGKVEVSCEGEDQLNSGDINIPRAKAKLDIPKSSKKKDGLGSCFGKKSNAEVELNVPSDIEAKVPSTEGSLELESPSLKGDLHISSSEAKVGIPKSSVKKKTSIGSCFGKKPKGDIDIDMNKPSVIVDIKKPSVEGTIDVESSSLQDDSSVPSGEVKIDIDKKPKKKVGIGSCFGKKSKTEVEMDKPSMDINVAGPAVEGSAALKVPDLPANEADLKISSPVIDASIDGKKQKSKFGSCFGKKEKLDLESDKVEGKIDVSSPELETSVDVCTPKVDIDIENIQMQGPELKAKGKKPSGEAKFKFGSCFGKEKTLKENEPSIAASGPAGKLEGSVELTTPESHIEREVKLKGAKSSGKKKLDFGSCFGKKDEPEVKGLRVEITEPAIPKTGLESELKIINPQVELGVEGATPEVKEDVKMEFPKAKVPKRKNKLTSCFGKAKSADVQSKAPVALEGGVNIDPELDVDLISDDKFPKKAISVKKETGGFGNCFGKRPRGSVTLKNDTNLPESRTVPEAEIKLKTDGECKIKPKVKGGLFSSCTGKKPKADVDIDVDIPEPRLSAGEVKGSVEIEYPDATVNQDFGVAGDVDIPIVSLSVPDVEFDIPKQDITFEGNATDISMSPAVNIELDSEIIDIKKNIDTSITLPDITIPEAKIDKIDIISSIIEVNEEAEIPKLPDFEKELQLNVDILNADIKVETPEMSTEVTVPKISGPEMKIDISSSLSEQDKELQIKGKDLDIKVPKGKGKSKLNCFGKKSVHADGEAYVPSGKVDVGAIEPSVSGEIELKEPKVSLTADVETPKLKTETKKSKMKFGSCFGKSEPLKDLNIESKVEVSCEGEDQSYNDDGNAPRVKGKLDIPKPSKKGRLGSCFGKKSSKAEVEINMPPDIEVKGPPIEGSLEVESPSLEGDLNISSSEAKVDISKKSSLKKKTGIGSCFGKKPKDDMDIDIDIKKPSVEGTMDVKLPSLQGDSSIPSEEVEDIHKKPKKKGGIGSCFGKKPKDQVEMDIPSVDVNVAGQSVEGSVSLNVPDVPENDADLKISSPVVSASIDDKKHKSKFGSCFGKKEKPELEIKSEKVEGKIDVPSPELEASVDVCSPKVDTDIENINLQEPKLKVKGKKPSGEGKFKFGSCFGKEKMTRENELNIAASGPSSKLESSAEVKTPETKIETDVELKGIKSSGEKKKFEFGSCFGKKLEPKIEVKGPKVEVKESFDSLTEVETELKIESPEVNVEGGVAIPEVKSDVEVKSKVPKVKVPKKNKLSSCFGKDNSADVHVKTPTVALEGDIKVNPELGALRSEEKLPTETISVKQKTGGLGSCFGKKPKNNVTLKNETNLSEGTTVSEAEVILKTDGKCKVKSKKPRGGLFSSCAGKKPKAGIDIDVPIPESEISANLPSEEIKGSIQVECPDTSFRRDISITDDVDISVVPLSFPDVKFNIPKQDNILEGKAADISMAPEVNIELDSEDIDMKKNIDMTITLPDIILPTAELDTIDIESPSFDVNAEANISKLPEIEKELQLNVGTPNVEMKIETPEMSPLEVNVPKISTPEIQIDISGSLPEAKDKELEIKGKDLNVKVPKGKVKNKLNCFGKKSVDVDGEAYVPSGKVDIGTNEPSVSGEIKVKEPKVSLTADVETPKLKTESKKSKMKFGSCFGKQEPSKDLKVEGKVEVSCEDEDQLNSGDINIPRAKAKLNIPKSSKKNDGLGSCFGKKSKAELEINTASDIEVKVPSTEGSLEMESSLKGDLNFSSSEAKMDIPKSSVKKKTSIGSCFGKKPKDNINIDKPSVTVDIKKPSVEGTIDIESSLQGDSSIQSGEVKVAIDKKPKKKAGIGSCFGKKSKAEVEMDKPSIDVKVTGPSVEGSAALKVPDIPENDPDIKISSPVVDASIDGKKQKSKFGSCFGKKEKLDLESDKVEGKIDVSSPEIGASVDVCTPKVDIDIENIQMQGPELKAKGKKPSGEAKFKFGSCFGKEKTLKENDLSIAASGPSGKLEGSIELTPETRIEREVKLKEATNSGKKKIEFSSCFGKKAEPKIDVKESKVGVTEPSFSETELEADLTIKSSEVNLEGEVATSEVKADIEVKSSKVKVSKKKNKLTSCFGKGKYSDVEVKTPSVALGDEVKVDSELDAQLTLEGNLPKPEAEIETELKIKSPKVELESGVSIPQVKADVEVKSPIVKVPKKKKSTSCFGKDKSADVEVEIPSVALEGEVTVNPDMGAQIISTPDALSVKKKRGGLGSCFGKEPKSKVTLENEATLSDVPEAKLKLKTDGESKITKKAKGGLFSSCAGKKSKADLDSDVYVPGPDLSIPSGKVKGNIEVECPDTFLSHDIDVTGEVDIPVVSVCVPDVKFDMPKQDITLEGKASDISMSPEVNIDADSEDIDIKKIMSITLPDIIVPTAEVNDIDLQSPSFNFNIDGETEIPKLPEIEKELQLNVGTPNVEMKIETPEISPLEVNVPKISAPEIQIDISGSLPEAKDKELEIKGKDLNVKVPKGKVKNKLNCFGKKSVDVDGEAYVPSGKVDIGTDEPSVSGEIKVKEPKVSLTADVETPKLKTEDKKSKMKFGSCFGKQEPSKGLDVEGKVEVSCEGQAQSDSSDVNVPSAKSKLDIPKSSKKKVGLGSCFGKKPKAEIDFNTPSAEIELDKPSSDIEVKVPYTEGSLEVASPSLKGDFNIPSSEAKLDVPKSSLKDKTGISSCFGRKRKDDIAPNKQSVTVEVMKPSVEGTMDIESPLLKGDSSISSVEVKVDIDKKPKNKGGIGSCFGKKSRAEIEMDKPSVDLKVEGPAVEGSAALKVAELPENDTDLKIGSPVVGTSIDGKKHKNKFGSCFGKKEKPELEIKPEKFEGEIGVSTAKLETSVDVDTDIENIHLQEPKLQVIGEKPSGEAKLKFGSCFGKEKKTLKVNEPCIASSKPSGKIESSDELKTPETDVELKGVKSSGKKKFEIGSCFGKKAEPKIEVKGPKVEVAKSLVPETEMESELKIKSTEVEPTGKLVGSAELKTPELNIETDVELKGTQSSRKRKYEFGSCFGKKAEPKIEAKEPKVEVTDPLVSKIEMETELKIKSSEVDLESKVTAPEVKADIEVESSKVKVLKKKNKLTSCFGKEKSVDIKIKTPSVALEGENSEFGAQFSSEGNLPKSETEIETGLKMKSPEVKLEGGVAIPLAKVDMEVKPLKVSKKNKLTSCFGKDKSADVDVKTPSVAFEGEAKVDPEVTAELASEGKLPKKSLSEKKNKHGLGSCFGKKPKGNVTLENEATLSESTTVPEVKLKFEADEIKTKPKKPKGGLFSSCAGKKPKADVDVDVSISEPDLSTNLYSEEVKGNIEVEFPDTSLSRDIGVTGGVDIPVVSLSVPDVEFNMPKQDINFEGKTPDISVSPAVNIDVISEDIDIKEKIDMSITLPDIIVPTGKIDEIDIKFPSIDFNVDSETDFPKLSTNENELQLNVETPTEKIEVETPEMSPLEVNVPQISTSEMKIEISSSLLDDKGKLKEVEGNTLDIVSTGTTDADAYNPSINIDVTGGDSVCDSETILKGSLPTNTEKSKLKGDSAKSKMKFGLCFGKSEPSKDIDIEGIDEVPRKSEDQSAGGAISSPRIEAKLDIPKSSKKKDGLGSCFGKKSKGELELNTSSDTGMKPSIEGSLEVRSPSLKGDLDNSSSEAELDIPKPSVKKKSSFGSCFGKKSKGSIETYKPTAGVEIKESSAEGFVDLESPSLQDDLIIPSGEVTLDVANTTKSKDYISINENIPATKLNINLLDPDFNCANELVLPTEFMVSASTNSPSVSINQEKFVVNYDHDPYIERNDIPYYENVKGYTINEESYEPEVNLSTKAEFPKPLDVSIPVSIPSGNINVTILPKMNADVVTGNIYANAEIDENNDHMPNIFQNEVQAKSELDIPFHEIENHLDNNRKSNDVNEKEVNILYPVKYDTQNIYENMDFIASKSGAPDINITGNPLADEVCQAPDPPKRWYGIDSTNVENSNEKNDISFENDSDRKTIEALSDFHSLQFVKQMVDTESEHPVNNKEIVEGKLGPFCISSSPKSIGRSLQPSKVDLLMKKLDEFDKKNYSTQPIVKRTVKVKTFKIKEDSNDPEEIIEEFEAEGEESAFDTAQLIREKLAELESDSIDCQPSVKRTVKIRTYKPKEGTSDSEEIIEEYEEESQMSFDDHLLRSTFIRSDNEQSDSNPKLRSNDQNVIEYRNISKHNSSGEEDLDPSELLIRKIANIDPEISNPVIKRTVKVKTYSTRDGEDEDTVVEEYEETQDSTLDRSEATQFLLKKIADFDGQGISGEPFVKRTVKVKTYKTKEGSDDPETIEEFEHSSTDMSLSEILQDKFPELRNARFESDAILRSLTEPLTHGVSTNQGESQSGDSSEL